ncbi:MAG: DUF805 domain-containing protein [Novosphingobium sp.]
MGKFFGQHLGGLLNFSGREAPKPFWLWAAFNLALQFAATFAVIMPMMFGMFQAIERFADAHPDQVTRTYGPGSYSVQVHGYHPELIPDFSGLFLRLGAMLLVNILLLAAAIVRRLHDCDRTGAWGLLPLPFLATGFVMMPRMFDEISSGRGEPDISQFLLLFFNNLIYLAALGVLIVLCARPGTPGKNRFGPPPS